MPGPRARHHDRHVRPVAHSRFRVDPAAPVNPVEILRRALRAMPLVAGDAGLRRVRARDSGGFEVTRLDHSTFTARVVAGETTDGNLATVLRLDDGSVAILVSQRLHPNLVERVVANALAQASAVLTGGAATANVLGATTHPANRTTLSEEDIGRQSELRNLDRAARNTLNPVRRLRIGREMRALVEHLGVHADDDAGPQRRALLDYDTRGILALRAKTGSRRPEWAGDPTGHVAWKAFRPHLVAELLPGLGAAAAIAGLGSPLVASGVAVATVTTAVTGTLVKRWHGRRDKTLVDSGHGYSGELRAYERSLRRRELLEPLLARMRSMGIDITVPGPPEPPPKGDWPKRTQPFMVRVANRGVPLLLGATAATLLVPGLPIYNVVTHWGIAGVAAIVGPIAEGWLRNRMVASEWKWFDSIFREADKKAAEFDEQFTRRLHAVMDRLDALAGVTSPQVTATSTPVQDSHVEQVGTRWFWTNAAPGAFGDFIREVTGAWTKVGEAFSQSLQMGELRFALGVLITGFLDYKFTKAEYGEIVTQVGFDADAKLAEQVALDHETLEAMLAALERQLTDAEAAAVRVAGSLPSRAAHLTAGTPAPPAPQLPANPADTTPRPVGRQGPRAFRRLGAAQGLGLWGVAAGGAQLLDQGTGPMIVVGVAATLVFGSYYLRYLFRRSEQDAVDASVLADRAKERVVEAAQATAIRAYLAEVFAREVAAAQKVAEAGGGPHQPPPPPVPPQVPPTLEARDPRLADHVEALVAYERERLLQDMRPVALLGSRLLGLERLNRLVARVREFERRGAAAPLAQARADLASTWQAYQELVSDGTPMPTDRELLAAATPAGDPTLRQYLDDSVAYPGGRALYAAGDPLRNSAATVPPDPARYTIDMHGGDGYVRVGRHRLTPAQVAAILRADPNWNGADIRLLACRTGQDPEGFAQQLADLLGVSVTAPTQYVGQTDDGQLFVTGLDTGPAGTRPVMPPTGELRTFRPRNPAPTTVPAKPQAQPADLDLDVANPWRLRGEQDGGYQPSQAELDLLARRIVTLSPINAGPNGRQRDEGENGAQFAELDEGAGVVKLAHLEAANMRNDIPPGVGPREAGAYRVDEMLGARLVPVTVVLNDGDRQGSLQVYVHGATEARPIEEYSRPERQWMAVLDYVIGNTDRHYANYMTDPDGRLIAIDNGHSFPLGTRDAIISSFVAAQLGKPLDAEVWAAVRAVDRNDMRRALLDLGIEQQAVDLAIARLAEIQDNENGVITGAAWGGQFRDGRGRPVERDHAQANPPGPAFSEPARLPDAVPPPRPGEVLAAAARRFLDESIGYEGGRAFYAVGDVLRKDAHLVPPMPGMYTVDLHGGTHYTRVGEDRVTPQLMAAILVADPNWDGKQPIRLLACQTGNRHDGFAQRLADLLGVPVLAPTEHVGVTEGGRVYVTAAEVNQLGIVVPVESGGGDMMLFQPRPDHLGHAPSERSDGFLDFYDEYLETRGQETFNPYRLRGDAAPGRQPTGNHPDPMRRGFWWPDHGEVVIGPMHTLLPAEDPPAAGPEPDGGDAPPRRPGGSPGGDRPGGPGGHSPEETHEPGGGDPGGGPDGPGSPGDAAEDSGEGSGAGGGPGGDDSGGGSDGGDSGGASGGSGSGGGEEQPEEPDDVDENVPPPGLEPIYTDDERLWPDELAELIANSPEWDGGPIRLLVLDGQVDAEFVRRLADLLGVPVLVPADAVVDGFPGCSSGTLEVYDEPAPVTPPEGDWRVVEPRTAHTATGTTGTTMAGTTVEAP